MDRRTIGVAPRMEIEIWSDIVCPWCAIGRQHLLTALERFPHRAEVTIVWRSFELDPAAPPERTGSYVDRLARKYGTSVEQAQGMIDRMTAAGADVGLDFRFERTRAGNTFDAHRLLHLAADRGHQDALKERLLRATFTEGQPIGDRATLARLATEVGLDAEEARAVLEEGRYADAVRADEAEAREIDVTGVPFFLVDRCLAISGAQPPHVLLKVLQHAYDERRPVKVVPGAEDAPECEGDNCAV